ncbi:MAG: fused MFS/spermidine synthase [candidate division FCPU426 bacterium]
MKTEWVTNDFGHVYQGKSLYQGRTKYQSMEIFENKTFGTLLFLDGKIQISEGDENRYHQYLVSAPLLAHPDPKTLLIIGGGDCFAIEEAVKFKSLERIVMVELDKGVVDFCRKHYPAIRKCLKDPRVEIFYEDARTWMERVSRNFDVLVVDLTEPHGPSKMLYTKEYYRLCAERMTADGILSIHTDNYYLFPESFATIYKTLSSVFPCIATARVDMPCFGMGWTYRMASARPITVARIENNLKKLASAGHVLTHFTPSLYNGRPTPEEESAIRRLGSVSTDKHPFDKFAALNKKVTS